MRGAEVSYRHFVELIPLGNPSTNPYPRKRKARIFSEGGSDMLREELQSLILNGEEDLLFDFKATDYNFSDQNKKTDFIKDVISMANTPRPSDAVAYIILGVKHVPGKKNEILGILRPQDDAAYQSVLKSDFMDGTPAVRAVTLEINGKNVVCIEIYFDAQNDRPYTCKKNFGSKIIAGQVYYRVGTTNTPATSQATANIYRWFSERILPDPILPPSTDHQVWDTLTNLMIKHRNKPNVLMILPSNTTSFADKLAPLGNVLAPHAVIDLDPDSENNGAFAHMNAKLSTIRQIHKIQPRDTPLLSQRSTTWYFAYGLDTRFSEQRLETRDWVRVSDSVFQLFRTIDNATSPNLQIVLMFVTESMLKRPEEEMLVRLASQDNTIIYVVTNPEFQYDKSGYFEFNNIVYFLSCGINEFIDALLYVISPEDSRSGVQTLPDMSGVPKMIPIEDQASYGEFVNFCYLEIADGDEGPEAFRKGGRPVWSDFYLNYDCERDGIKSIVSSIIQSLQRRRRDRFNIYHSPGSGGTTVAMRIIWDVHSKYPAGELLSCTPPANVAARLREITQKIGNSLLLLVETSRFSRDEIEVLFEYIRAEQIPVVLLQVSRWLGHHPFSSRERSHWIPAELSSREARLFSDAYKLSVPHRREAISRVLKNKQEWQCISFGLAAYSSAYKGINNFVEIRMQRLTPTQRKILIYFALAYYYGQQSLSPQYFSQLLEKIEPYMDLNTIFQGDSYDAIDLLLEEENGEYRIMHQLIAEKILEIGLGVSWSDSGPKPALYSIAKEFAEILAQNGQSQNAKRILHRLFIERTNTTSEMPERPARTDTFKETRRFSELISDLPHTSQLALFNDLSLLFPEDTHIHAHKARINSYHGNFEIAKDSIEYALQQNDHDDVLYHIYGTIIQNRIHYLIHEARKYSKINLDVIKDLTNKALENFAISRKLDPHKEHAYTSVIYLCTDIIETSKKLFNLSITDLLQHGSYGAFFVHLLQVASEALDGIEDLYTDSANISNYGELCRAKLARARGEYSEALQCYNNLLSRNGFPKAQLRRLIAYAYSQKDGDYTPFYPAKIASKVFDLMQVNIKDECNYDKNMPLYLRAARSLSVPPSIEAILTSIQKWKLESPRSLNALFYHATLVSLQVINGAYGLLDEANEALKLCKQVAMLHPQRTSAREWLANGSGIKGLVPHKMVGKWNNEIDFFSEYSNLRQIDGRISGITDNSKGVVTLKCGLKAFFIPGRFDVHKGKDENTSINFYLAFSYDGLIAWHLPTAQATHLHQDDGSSK